MSNSRGCIGVNGEALQLLQFIKSRIFYCKSHENPYQYYKSRENPYQVLQVTHTAFERAYEIEGLYDKIIITIVPSYTRKNHLFVAIGIVTCAAHS